MLEGPKLTACCAPPPVLLVARHVPHGSTRASTDRSESCSERWDAHHDFFLIFSF